MLIKVLEYIDLINLFKNDDGLIDSSKVENFKYFDINLSWNQSVIGAFKNNELVGLAQYGQNKEENRYWLSFVSVHPNHRQKGVAQKLIQFILEILNKEESRFELSSYEKEGEVMIDMIQRLASNYPNLKIFHRQQGQSYQLATNHFFKIGELISINDPENGFKGLAHIKNIIDLGNSIQIYYNTDASFNSTSIENCSPIK